jgi:hypothetical protein
VVKKRNFANSMLAGQARNRNNRLTDVVMRDGTFIASASADVCLPRLVFRPVAR